MYRLKYRRQARNYLARLSLNLKAEIIDRLHALAEDPEDPALETKRLKGKAGFRLRVRQFRVIYTRHDDHLIIEIVKVRPRGDIYKR